MEIGEIFMYRWPLSPVPMLVRALHVPVLVTQPYTGTGIKRHVLFLHALEVK